MKGKGNNERQREYKNQKLVPLCYSVLVYSEFQDIIDYIHVQWPCKMKVKTINQVTNIAQIIVILQGHHGLLLPIVDI